MKKIMILLCAGLFAAFGLFAVSCDDDDNGGKGTSDADSDADSDGDADADSDADSDADADTDPMAGYDCDNVDSSADPCLNLMCESNKAEQQAAAKGVACVKPLIDCLQDGCKPGTAAADINYTIFSQCSSDFSTCMGAAAR